MQSAHKSTRSCNTHEQRYQTIIMCHCTCLACNWVLAGPWSGSPSLGSPRPEAPPSQFLGAWGSKLGELIAPGEPCLGKPLRHAGMQPWIMYMIDTMLQHQTSTQIAIKAMHWQSIATCCCHHTAPKPLYIQPTSPHPHVPDPQIAKKMLFPLLVAPFLPPPPMARCPTHGF